MSTPLVTIYTITRNRCDLLPRAMKSILNQTYRNIEYIIIDSASTDDTEKVVRSFPDNRIRYVKLDQNETFGHCVNMAVHLATGKYVTELDDDDEYHLDKIEKQIQLFETLPEDYGMVYCWMTYYDNVTGKLLQVHKAELKGDVLDKVIEKPIVSGTPTLLFRKEIFDLIGGYKESEEIGIESDWEFATRICKHYKVDYVPESLVNIYINHGHTRMSNSRYYAEFDKKQIKFHFYFLNKYEEVFKSNPQITWYHLRCIVTAYFHMGDFKNGFKYYKKLLGVNHNVHCVIAPVEAVLRRLLKR